MLTAPAPLKQLISTSHTKNCLPNIHPSEVLREGFLQELAISPEHLAHDLRLPLTPVAELLSGQTRLTADLALRLGRYFGNSPKF